MSASPPIGAPGDEHRRHTVGQVDARQSFVIGESGRWVDLQAEPFVVPRTAEVHSGQR